jgi:hypothetical protein
MWDGQEGNSVEPPTWAASKEGQSQDTIKEREAIQITNKCSELDIEACIGRLSISLAGGGCPAHSVSEPRVSCAANAGAAGRPSLPQMPPSPLLTQSAQVHVAEPCSACHTRHLTTIAHIDTEVLSISFYAKPLWTCDAIVRSSAAPQTCSVFSTSHWAMTQKCGALTERVRLVTFS